MKIECVDCDAELEVVCTRQGRHSLVVIPEHEADDERGWVQVVGESYKRFADVRRACTASGARILIGGRR